MSLNEEIARIFSDNENLKKEIFDLKNNGKGRNESIRRLELEKNDILS